jgi:spore coat polysaccharide biosynthesis protein SpsF
MCNNDQKAEATFVDIVAIIQARMGSTRLPGKVLMNILGQPMLERVVERTRRAKLLRNVVVATSVNAADNAILQLCESRGWLCFCGSEDDVLDRYFQAASRYRSDAVVRISSDCPLIDPQLVDHVVQIYLDAKQQLDYVSNSYPARTFPLGLDVEVLGISALRKAWKQDKNPRWREHVTPYVYRHPEEFKLRGVANGVDLSEMRWTVDTGEDLEFVRRVYEHFGHDRFSWRDVLSVLQDHQEWLIINRHVQQKSVST